MIRAEPTRLFTTAAGVGRFTLWAGPASAAVSGRRVSCGQVHARHPDNSRGSYRCNKAPKSLADAGTLPARRSIGQGASTRSHDFGRLGNRRINEVLDKLGAGRTAAGGTGEPQASKCRLFGLGATRHFRHRCNRRISSLWRPDFLAPQQPVHKPNSLCASASSWGVSLTAEV